MPRVPLSEEQKKAYKLKDFKKWVKMQMAATGKTQSDVGKALGLSQSQVSQMLKRYDPETVSRPKVNPDPFSYGQVITLCELFGADGEERKKLLML